jgi:tetratricopeptide (TPR) repeat protein
LAGDQDGRVARPAAGDTTHSALSGSAGNVVQARDVAGGVHFHTPVPAGAPRPAQLPADVRGFVNRARELHALDSSLADGGSESDGLRVTVIVGTAGVGKTSLAVRWAHRVRGRFPDGQLYVNLRGHDPGAPVTAADALGRFLRALDIPVERIPAGEESRAELFRSMVAERRLLVVLDNAAAVSQIRPLLPGAAQCLVVVTSRSRLSGLVARDGAYRVSVETLSQVEAVQLLRSVLAGYRSADSEEELAELARLCARLPLALRIAAERAAARPRMPLAELIAELRDESGLWDALSAEEAEESDAVGTVFAWSYRALSPQAARVFRLLGMHPGPDFALEAAAALAAVTPVQARRLLDTLVGAHLLEECGHDRYQFHDLLRAYAADQAHREEAEENLRGSVQRLLSWYLHGAIAAARAGSDAYVLPVGPEPLPDELAAPSFDDHKAAIGWYETERDNLIAAVRTAAAFGLDRIAWQIPSALTMIIGDRESAEVWLPVQELALHAARRAGDRYGEAIALDNLGVAYRHLFDLAQAEASFQAAFTAFQDVDDLAGQARAANGLGVVQLFARLIDDAVASFERALSLAGELGHRAFIGSFTRNLGWAVLEHGDLDRAQMLLGRAATMLRQADEPLEEAEALTLLAAALRRSHQLERARESAEHALSLAGEFDGTLFEALALLELGRIHAAQRSPADALGHLHQAAALFLKIGRLDLQATAWDATGEAYLLLDRPQEAADYCRRAASAHRNRGDRWQLALSVTALADALASAGELLQAREHRREAAQLLTQFSDPVATTKHAALAAKLTNE